MEKDEVAKEVRSMSGRKTEGGKGRAIERHIVSYTTFYSVVVSGKIAKCNSAVGLQSVCSGSAVGSN